MVRSAPPQNVSLPEVTTAPLMAASLATFSTIASSSSITFASMTFIERPGMFQVTSAMPSASTSKVKLVKAMFRSLSYQSGPAKRAEQLLVTDRGHGFTPASQGLRLELTVQVYGSPFLWV